MSEGDKSSDFYELATRCISHNEDIVLDVRQAESIVWSASEINRLKAIIADFEQSALLSK